MKFAKILAIALCAAVLAGCCYCKKYERLYGRPLEKTNWNLAQVDGRPVTATYVMVLSKDKKMTIMGQGSTLTASYYINNDGLMRITDIVRSGTPEDPALEDRLVDMLGRTTNYKMDGLFVMMIINAEVWALFETHDPKSPKPKKVWDENLQEYVIVDEN